MINKAAFSQQLGCVLLLQWRVLRVCVESGSNGACRVRRMLIAWMGALVNSSNVFSGIKGSKLSVTIDFERGAASLVHYMGALSPYFRR